MATVVAQTHLNVMLVRTLSCYG